MPSSPLPALPPNHIPARSTSRSAQIPRRGFHFPPAQLTTSENACDSRSSGTQRQAGEHHPRASGADAFPVAKMPAASCRWAEDMARRLHRNPDLHGHDGARFRMQDRVVVPPLAVPVFQPWPTAGCDPPTRGLGLELGTQCGESANRVHPHLTGRHLGVVLSHTHTHTISLSHVWGECPKCPAVPGSIGVETGRGSQAGAGVRDSAESAACRLSRMRPRPALDRQAWLLDPCVICAHDFIQPGIVDNSLRSADWEEGRHRAGGIRYG